MKNLTFFFLLILLSSNTFGEKFTTTSFNDFENSSLKMPLESNYFKVNHYQFNGINYKRSFKRNSLSINKNPDLDFNSTVLKKNLLSPMNCKDFGYLKNFTYNPTNYRKKSAGEKIGMFFLGAVVGAGAGALTGVLLHGDETGPGTDEYYDNRGKIGYYAAGGAVLGGVLFIIDY
jgi:hypothetical protein